MAPIVIIGGGITGLSAAWELQQHGVDYAVLEASDRFGGKLITERVNGFIIEAGADSFLTTKPWAWHLVRELGFTEEMMPTSTEKRAVYVYRHGKLHLFPRGMRLIVPMDPAGLLESDLLSLEGKVRMLAEVDVPPRTETGDESLASFVRRRFGSEALEVFGESLLSGIHVADPEQLSIESTFPNYPLLERTYGSVIQGMKLMSPPVPDPDIPKSTFVSPRNGMQSLIEALQAKLTGTLRLTMPVDRITADRRLVLKNGESLPTDGVIVTTPASVTGHLVEEFSPNLGRQLTNFRTVSSGTVSLGFRIADLPQPLDGYGFVIPRSEPTHITACTWSSTKLAGRAPEGYALIRVFLGGHGREADIALPDTTLIQLARSELSTIMGINADPVITRVFRWRGASPQYEVGHQERVTQLRELTPSWMQIAGCAFDGVGVPDCVRQGRQAARQLLKI